MNVGDFLSASYFLKYSSSLYVVNVNPGAKSSDGVCQGKYPGSLGNKIDVSVCGPIDAADSDQLTNEFDNGLTHPRLLQRQKVMRYMLLC